MSTTPDSGGVSEADAKFDQMAEQASIPSLASLFRTAKKQGVIVPLSNYGEGYRPPQGGQPQP